MDKPAHIVLLLAGGKGERMHSNHPKQFLEVGGQPVITYPLQTFQQHAGTDCIYVVCAPEWSDFVTELARRNGIGKFVRTLPAGATSIESIRNGIRGIRQDAGDSHPAVMLHEAVRPLLSAELITANFGIFHSCGNAITAIKSNEAYMVSTDGRSSTASIPRERLYRAQTPQTFWLEDIEEAFARAERLGLNGSQSLYTLMTETCPEKALYIAPGNELNFKLTRPEDIEMLSAQLAFRHDI